MRKVIGSVALATILLEVFVLWLVGHYLGAVATFLLVVASMVLGGWLVRREGARAWRELRAATAAGRSPESQLLDGALVLTGGALMLVPGFVTDLLGLALLVPPVRRALHRPVAMAALRVVPLPGVPRHVRARRGAGQPYVPAGASGTATPGSTTTGSSSAGSRTAGDGAGRVIDGIVVDREPRA